MKLGVNTLFYIPGQVGGSETYLKATLRALVREFPGLSMVLFTNCENHGELTGMFARTAGVESVRLNFRATNRFARIIREQVELPRRARGAGVDVLWSPGYTAPLWAPCPQVATVLDMQYKRYPEDLTRLAWLMTAILVPLAVRRSRRVLAISEFSKTEIVKYTGVSPEKVSVTPLAADEMPAPPMEAAAARERASALTGSTAPYLLVMSHTYPHKNVASAVAAFGRLQDRIPHRMVLVGRPRRGEAAVQAAVASLPEPARFRRLEWVAGEDVAVLRQAADVLVHPSLYEGFGLPVLEAMAAGLPVVTGRFGAIPEVGGDACVYVDSRSPEALAAGIAEVLGWDAAARSRQADKGRCHAARFTWRQTATATMRCLKGATRDAR